MLILSRHAGQRIFIGNDITVTVMETHKGRVQIGIDAPKEIAIHREEVQARIDREKAAAGVRV